MLDKVDVVIAMGSKSDWPTLKHAQDLLNQFGVSVCAKVISAHRTPKLMMEFGESLKTSKVKVVIAGAGGAAHLPGMLASICTQPVFGVPINVTSLNGIDSLLSIVQMPGGIPVGTLAIGDSGAKNAALLAIRVLAQYNAALKEKLNDFIKKQEQKVIESQKELV